MPDNFFLLSHALSLLYFIVTCLILYLIKSHLTLLSVTISNSSNHIGTLWVINVRKFSSLSKLALNFQNDGLRFWLSILLK